MEKPSGIPEGFVQTVSSVSLAVQGFFERGSTLLSCLCIRWGHPWQRCILGVRIDRLRPSHFLIRVAVQTKVIVGARQTIPSLWQVCFQLSGRIEVRNRLLNLRDRLSSRLSDICNSTVD